MRPVPSRPRLLRCSTPTWLGSIVRVTAVFALATVARLGGAAECGFIEEYGEGCPGAGGASPQLRIASPCLAPLSPITLELTTGPGEKLAFLVLGAAHFTVDLTPSCFLQVGEFFPYVVPIALPTTGRTWLDATLPRESSGIEIFVQAVVLDDAAPFHLAASNPLGIYVGA